MHLVQLRTRPDPGSVPDASAPAKASTRPLVDAQARRVRYLRISLTDRCNYRCTYCMPPEGVSYGSRSDVLSLEEIVQLCATFARWGVRRVRLTGGEPTLRKGLIELVRRLAGIPTDRGALEVVMTTNAQRLAELAAPLADAGLSSLTVSLDSLDPARFAQITRRGDLDRVLEGIEAARRVGLRSLKLNTVAVEGFNDGELADIARYAWDHKLTPRFIEVMPMAAGALFVPGELMSAARVRDTIAAGLGTRVVPDDGKGVAGSGPASYWRLDGGAYDGYRFGTIAAMTENFCNTCNRLRISATGRLHACLARDETGDLRAALRGGDPSSLESVVRSVVGAKKDGHGFNIDGTGGPTKAMISIGG